MILYSFSYTVHILGLALKENEPCLFCERRVKKGHRESVLCQGLAPFFTDGGLSWEIFQTAATGYNVGIAALDGTTAWAVSTGGGGGSGNIVNTNDSGKTWNIQPYPEQNEFHLLSDVAFEKGL